MKSIDYEVCGNLGQIHEASLSYDVSQLLQLLPVVSPTIYCMPFNLEGRLGCGPWGLHDHKKKNPLLKEASTPEQTKVKLGKNRAVSRIRHIKVNKRSLVKKIKNISFRYQSIAFNE